jgi:hypothetical protein
MQAKDVAEAAAARGKQHGSLLHGNAEVKSSNGDDVTGSFPGCSPLCSFRHCSGCEAGNHSRIAGGCTGNERHN